MSTMSSMPRRAAPVAVLASVAIVLGGCGGDGGTNDSTSDTRASVTAQGRQHNRADVTFTQRMVPHHRQAIEMAEMARTHTTSTEIKAFAAKVEHVRTAELATMCAWLEKWGEEIPRGTGARDDPARGHDREGHHDARGMTHQERMRHLDGTHDAEFDRSFLTMMTDHHQGAIDQARAVKSTGAHAATKALADTVISTRSAEIARMKAMMGVS
ncbi:DUF305 domain-containing protein [Streptomyces flavofungini]|uniref:DUF305 domain-containing protein n=1 Tax=Streptomyces flavofungini TaxID=68200 RepID=UPI0025AF1AFC|nr:DUF305 domain-containing protein [Streptomyces flavofungini]WJV44738.1 DUF305 domain-containing protein [Streptomyces flavofungini]